MKKLFFTIPAVLLAAAAFNVSFGQEFRIYNDGVIDYVPLQASFVIDADDEGSALEQIQVSIDGSELGPYSTAISFDSEGRHVIVYRASDRTANVSAEKIYSVVVDGTPPDGSAGVEGPLYVSGSDELYLTGESTIVLWAEDELSGVDRIFVSLDGGPYTAYNRPVSITEEGPHTASAYAVDNVGNRTAEFEIAGYVDSSPPAVSIVPARPFVEAGGSRYTSRMNELSVRAEDALSGVQDIRVSLDGSDYVSYDGPFQVQSAGVHVLRAAAVDYLGNRSEPVSVRFFVDTEPPDTSMGVSVK